MEQLPLTAQARRTDPETSHAAAGSVRDISKMQYHVLGVFKLYGPMTDEAAYRQLHHLMSASGARTRRRELVDGGLMRDTGKRGQLASGRQAIVWEVI